jgi:predicted deacylase
MRHLGMLDDGAEGVPTRYRLWKIHTDIANGPVAGILSMHAKRGDHLEPGDTFGVVHHPFNGEEIARIASPARGTVMDSGVVWPVVRPGQWLAALGDVVREVTAGEEA